VPTGVKVTLLLVNERNKLNLILVSVPLVVVQEILYQPLPTGVTEPDVPVKVPKFVVENILQLDVSTIILPELAVEFASTNKCKNKLGGALT
jgi:hypothetical protein